MQLICEMAHRLLSPRQINLGGNQKELMKPLKPRWLALAMTAVLMLAIPTVSIHAADFNLAWDYSPSDEHNLIGYNIYYKAEESILADPDGSIMIYVPLSEDEFDPYNPGYSLTDLLDDTTYYFTVTAVYEDTESPMSNEVGAVNGDPIPGSNLQNGTSNSSSGASGAGCFIDTIPI